MLFRVFLIAGLLLFSLHSPHAYGIENKPASSLESPEANRILKQPDNSQSVKANYDPYSDRLYRAYLLATVIGVIGGIVGIAILIWQAIINRTVATAARASAEAASDNVASLKIQIVEMKMAREQTVAEMQSARLQTERLITQAETSASAAKASADAAIAAERAWITAELHPGPGRGTDPIDRTADEPGQNRIRVHVLLVCANEGRTPAWVDEIRVQFAVTENLQPMPDIDSMELVHNEPVPLPAGGRMQPDPVFQLECVGKEDMGKMSLVYGAVKYRDAFGGQRRTLFAYIITPDHKLQRLAGFPAYNKHT